LPFLLKDFRSALYLAYIVASLELFAIAYIRYHFFRMKFWMSAVQVVLGGVLVVLAGLLIGSA
jgi:hypothetical protein